MKTEILYHVKLSTAYSSAIATANLLKLVYELQHELPYSSDPSATSFSPENVFFILLLGQGYRPKRRQF